MASNRLTNSIRQSIVTDLIKHAFLDRAQAQLDAECLLIKQIWDDIIGAKQSIIDSAPTGWFQKGSSFKIAIDREVTRLNLIKGFSSGYNCRLKLVGAKVASTGDISMPYNAACNSCLKNYESDSILGKRLQDLTASHDLLSEAIDSSQRTAKATLLSVSSITKLIDIWPECAVFAEPYRTNGEQKAILPAIPRAELNAALCLPPEVNGTAAGTVVT
jgi:hypothetical protein